MYKVTVPKDLNSAKAFLGVKSGRKWYLYVDLNAYNSDTIECDLSDVWLNLCKSKLSLRLATFVIKVANKFIL